MTVLAVLLGVAFVSGTLVFTDTLGSAYTKQSQVSFRNVSVVAVGAFDERTLEEKRFTEQQLLQLRKLPGAQSVTGAVSGFTVVAAKDGSTLGGKFENKGGNWFPGQNGEDSRYKLIAGRGPARPGEMALDQRSAAEGGYEVGDTVRLSVSGSLLKHRLIGVFHTDDNAVEAGGSLTLFDNATAQKLFGEPGHYAQFDLRAKSGTSQEQLRSEAQKVLPKDAKVRTAAELSRQQAAASAKENESVANALLAFAAISLGVGIFVIANTYTMLVTQRAQEVALMRAVGASRRQIARSVLLEAAFLGLFAGTAGFVTGIAVAVALRSLLRSTGATLPDGPLVISPSAVLAAFLVGVVVTTVSAWLPARRAAKVPPVAAMSAVHAAPTDRGIRRLNLIGGVLTALGVLSVFTAAQAPSEKSQPLVLAGSGVLIIGVFLLTPALCRPVIGLAAPLLARFGVPGTLAPRNARRNPRRTASTASALMIGLSLVTGLTVAALSTTAAVEKKVVSTVKADFTVDLKEALSLTPDFYDTLARTQGVTAVSPLRYGSLKSKDGEIDVTGVEVRSIGKLLTPHFVQGSMAALHAHDGKTLVADRFTADYYGWSDGDRVPVTYEDGKRDTLRIVGIFEDNENLPGLMMPLSTLNAHQSEHVDGSILVDTASGDSDQARRTLQQALGNNPLVLLLTIQDLVDESGGDDVTLVLNILYSLLAMSLVIAVLGVVNTLAMSVFERTQEIGMLRAVGLDQQQTKRMVHLEAVLISLFGALLGIGVGLYFGWAAGRFAADSIDDYTMVVPWGRIGLAFLAAGFIGVLAGLWPARRAAALNVLAAIKAD
ncbi:ABC transporter permease [Streptomyces phaeochromogenes]|uniref:ABC transporter permease n=1 Tax=Streptomyces phaeochromogenes TaxID=1923 RepID=UPI0036C349C3